MKLALVGPVHPFRGGIAHFGARLARELSDSDECLLISFKRLYPDFLFPGKSQFDSGQSSGLQSERLLEPLNPTSWRRTAKRIAKFDPEAVIIHFWHPFFAPSYRYLVRRLPRSILRIVISHNISPHERTSILSFATKLLFKEMDGFLVHADSELDDLLAIVANPLTRTAFHPVYDIFPGSDMSREEARQRLSIPKKSKLALYFGLIRSYKGVDLFFEACGHLSEIPDLKMLAVGEVYSDAQNLRATVERLPTDRAQLIDKYIPDDQVATYFRAADVVVLPYRSATQSGVVATAYACDRPVIVTDVGGLSEAVIDQSSGLIVPPGDSHALADAIRRFFTMDDPDRFGPGIALMRQKFGWPRYAVILHELIAEAAKR